MLAIPYIKAPVNHNPFLDLPLSARPQIVSGCTLVFSISSNGTPYILVGQQNSIKAGQHKTNIWDLSGGGLHENEPYVLGATREFSEELGLLPKHTEALPYNIFKLFEEDGKLKAKVIFIRYFDCYSLLKYPNEFIQRCRSVIKNLDDRFEYTRLGLVSLDNFFAQIAVNDQHHPEMPKAEIKYLSPWIVADKGWAPEHSNRWRKSVQRIYNHPLMQNFVRGLIKEFLDMRQARKFISDVITPFPVADFAPKLDLNTFKKSRLSNHELEILEGENKDGIPLLAKTLHDRPAREIAYSVRNEEISRRCYELAGVNVVPGSIATDGKNGKAYYVMLDINKAYSTTKFNIGASEHDLADVPDLCSKPQILAEMQAGFLVSLLLANTQDIFKRSYWCLNQDGSFGLLAGNFTAAAALVEAITPTQIYFILTQHATKTCVNESFNSLINHDRLKMIEIVATHGKSDVLWEILKQTIVNKEQLISLLREFAIKFNDAAITAIVTAGFAQLPARHEYADEIAWRSKKLNAAIEEADLEFDKVQDLDTAYSKTVIDQYFIKRGLLAMSEYQIDEMQKYSSEQEHMTRTLISRRSSILHLFARLIPEFRAEIERPLAERSAYVNTLS